MDYQLNDERLAWLAVRDELSRRSRGGSWFGKLLDAMGGRQYSIGGDGKVPDWFPDKVQETYDEIHEQR